MTLHRRGLAKHEILAQLGRMLEAEHREAAAERRKARCDRARLEHAARVPCPQRLLRSIASILTNWSISAYPNPGWQSRRRP